MNLQLHTGTGSEKRRELDFYPTPRECTIALIEFIHKMYPYFRNKIIWEPACGNYAISEVLQSYGHKMINTDIIYGTDYLGDVSFESDALITNPPFKLAENFIKKAVSSHNLVAMLLKTQYWHSKKRFALFSTHKPSYILPLTWRPDFLNGERGGSPTMDVIWTLWIHGDTCTKYHPLTKP